MKFPHLKAEIKQLPLHGWQIVILACYFLSLMLGQVGRIEWHGLSVYLHDFCIVLWLSWWFIDKKMEVFTRLKSLFTYWRSLLLLILTLSLATLIGLVAKTAEVTSILYLGRLLTYVLFFYSLRDLFKNTKIHLLALLVGTGILTTWLGFLQYLFFPDLRFLYTFGWDDHYYRLASTLLDPNYMGLIITITGIAWLQFRKKVPMQIWYLVFSALGLALLLTYSRSSYLTAVLVMAAYFAFQATRKVPWKPVILIGCTLLLIFSVAPRPGGEGVKLLRTRSIVARVQAIESGIQTITGYQWLIGRGFYPKQGETSDRSITVQNHTTQSDNIVVLLLTNTGMVGLVLFSLLVGQKLKTSIQHTSITSLIVIAALVHGQFNNVLEPIVLQYIGVGLASLDD